MSRNSRSSHPEAERRRGQFTGPEDDVCGTILTCRGEEESG